MAGPIDTVFISVSSLDASLALYRDYAGMKVRGEEDLSPAEVQQLFNLPSGTEAHAVYLGCENQTSTLELIEFRPRSQIPIRQKVKDRDLGIYDVAFSVENLEAIHRDLTAKGFAFVSAPHTYSPYGPKVRQAILVGPDNMHTALIERVPEPDVARPVRWVRMGDSAQLLENMDEAVAFYHDFLGLERTRDRVYLPAGTLDEVLGVPRGTRPTIEFFNRKGTTALTVELIELSVKGKSLAKVARPPNLGVFMVSFQVDGLAATVEGAKQRGYRVLSGPIEFATRVHGKVQAITVEAPSGVMVELFQK